MACADPLGEAISHLHASRVLPEDSYELRSICGVVGRVLQVVQQAQRQVHPGAALGHDLGPAPQARQAVPDVAVVLLDGERQVLAGEQLLRRDHAVVAFPTVGDERLASESLFDRPRWFCVVHL